MDKTHFYIVLPSDSSMRYYPDNTVACYNTKLPREIQLEGKWEVALTEIAIPLTFYTIPNWEKYHASRDIQVKRASIKDPLGYEEVSSYFDTEIYELPSIVHQMNEEIKEVGLKLVILPNGYIQLECIDDGTDEGSWSLELDNVLGEILGLPEILRIGKRTEFILGQRPADITFHLPKWIYVYTNICEPSVVGDVNTTILRSLPIKYSKTKLREIYHVTIAQPNYIPLLSNSFQDIEIDLRDRLGKSLPFTAGTSSVTLHFRRIE